jgi:hypothetical protein
MVSLSHLLTEAVCEDFHFYGRAHFFIENPVNRFNHGDIAAQC